ncbi:MAG: heavy metal-binding domain-containing protein [Acidimicrobiia bacterium]|nr:heavy metal-binding domain-containing protein [Acidimicrobiia bacterium]
MVEILDLLNLIIPLIALIGFGWWGFGNERRHLKDLEERERIYAGIVVIDTATIPEGVPAARGVLVAGSVVQASDYLKSWLLGWRALFGGEVISLGRVITRARREAMLRMKEEANRLGATVVVNVRYETSRLGQAQGRGGMPSSEVVCYGTALLPR